MSRVLLVALLSPTLFACAQDAAAQKGDVPAQAASPADPQAEQAEQADAKLPGEVEIAAGVVVAGQPDREQLAGLKARGFAKVINLRGADEPGALADEQSIVEGAGMTYVHIDAGKGADALTEENAKKLGEALAGDGPVLVHCGSGTRATTLYALHAVVNEGRSDDEAKAMVEKSGHTRMLEKLAETLAERVAD